MTDLYRPKEARDRLDVSESTLRRWCADFAEWLSPGARQAITETGGVAQRMFTESDLEFLARVKHALADRQSSDDVRRRLDAGETLPPPPPRRAAPEPPVSGFVGPPRPHDGVHDEVDVVERHNAVAPLANHPLYLMLEDLAAALEAQETRQAERHREALAQQQQLIDATREQTMAQRELAAALLRQADAAELAAAAPPAVPIPESAVSPMERVRRWFRGSG